jgi:ABC-2 type transport system ATP-binding protein
MTIQVNNIEKSYNKEMVLRGISFEISKGEIVGLLGSNGAGKSTLMRIITSYIPANSGYVNINGLNVIENSIIIRGKIGYLPENNPLYNEMYVREYLEFILGIQKKNKKKRNRINEVLEMTGLENEQFKKISSLSKGYKQRVGIAQALINNPDVLILDEPTTGLDPNQLIEIRDLIKEIGKNKTVLFSTHIMQEVEALCDRVIILNNGEIIVDTTILELKRKYSSSNIIYVEFDQKVNISGLERINGVSSVYLKSSIYEFESIKEIDIRSEIFQYAVDKGIKVLSMNQKEKSMEQVFQDITKSAINYAEM